MPARLTKCSTVRRYSSSTCRARSGCSAPKRFRAMQRTARTEQLPRLRHGRELHDIRKTSGVLPSDADALAPIAAPPWTRQSSPSSTNPRGHFRSWRVSGPTGSPESSRSRLSSRPRSLLSADQSSDEPTAAVRRFRNRRSSASSPHPETAVRLGRSACEDIGNVRRITPLSADASSTELRSICSSRQRLLATSPPQEGQCFVLRHRHAIRGSTISRCASP